MCDSFGLRDRPHAGHQFTCPISRILLRLYMPKKPRNTTKSPPQLDSAVDVFGEILEAIHLRTAIFGKIDLGAPWHLRLPERSYLTFYVVVRGSAWLEFPKGTPHLGRGGTEIALSTGDAVILPLGSAHDVRDADR